MIALLYEVIGGSAVGLSLGLIGAGGAILSVPIFAEALHHPPKQAIAEALIVTCAVALSGAIRAALKRSVDWPRVALMGVPGIAGAALGAWLGRNLSDPIQMSLFAIVALVAAWRMLVPAPHVAETQPQRERRHTVAAIESAAVGLGIGALTGVIGVGGGFLLVPALVVILHEPMHRAVGTSLAIIALNCAAGYAGAHMGTQSGSAAAASAQHAVDWQAVATVTTFGIVGSLAGGLVGDKLPNKLLRQIFACLLVSVAALIIVRQVTA